MDLVDEYHEKIGGAPIAPSSSKKKGGKGGKRSAAAATLDSPAPEPKKRGRKPMEAANGVLSKNLPDGLWEEDIVQIHTVLEEVKGEQQVGGDRELLALVEWKNRSKSQHPLKVLRRKCPQRLLDYYEKHL
jgi:chromobox protein 1